VCFFELLTIDDGRLLPPLAKKLFFAHCNISWVRQTFLASLPRSVAGGWKRFRVGRFSTTKDSDGDHDAEIIPIKTIQADIDIDWNDRIGLYIVFNCLATTH
jgi:hypothetical protein